MDWQRFFDSAVDLYCVTTLDGTFVWVSPSFREVLGWSVDEAVGRPFLEWVHPEDRSRTRSAMDVLREGERVEDFLNRYASASGNYHWLEWRSVPADGHVYATARDVTERRTTRRRLEQSRHALQAAQRIARIGSWSWDMVEDRIRWSDQLRRILGDVGSRKIDTFADFLDFVHPEDRTLVTRDVEAVRHGESDDFDHQCRLVDSVTGALTWIHARGRVVARDTVGRPIRMGGTAQDITLQLAREEERYRTIVETAPVGIVRSGLDGTIHSANDEYARIAGYGSFEELAADGVRTTPDFYQEPEQRRTLIQALETEGRVRGHEVSVTRRDGSVAWTLVDAVLEPGEDGKTPFILGFVRDITRERSLRKQFLHSQKMEAIGTLAGGVAHDFNNLLTVILTNAELLLMDTPHEPLVEEIREAAGQARSVTGKLLAFSRSAPVHREVLHVNEVVEHNRAILDRLLRPDVILDLVLEPDLPAVAWDRSQLQQVVLNLVVNAQDAMPSGGRITIHTRSVDGGTVVDARVQLEPGPYQELGVSDTGEGIGPETRTRIFDPFFTTKEEGKGTGLGLSTVKGIVEESGGHIVVDSELGRGTTFRILLPVDPALDDAVPDSRSRTPDLGSEGSGTILLVEDEKAVRRTTDRVLTRLDYRVLPAADVPTTLKLWEEYAPEVDLLVIDVGLPGARGPQLVARLRRDRPDLPALHVSGYTSEEVREQGELDPDVPFLTKPYGPGELARAVEHAMAGRVPGNAAAKATGA